MNSRLNLTMLQFIAIMLLVSIYTWALVFLIQEYTFRRAERGLYIESLNIDPADAGAFKPGFNAFPKQRKK